MTNFVIVCCLPPVAQPQVLHSNGDSALGVLSVPYSKLYNFSLSAKLGRDTTTYLGVAGDNSVSAVLPKHTEFENLFSSKLVFWPLHAWDPTAGD